ncbi:hypothetical protein Acsp06_33150 [Actinomycetospora sp. NBRC 106375]|uniref:DUF6703 family protein n=1 Tax=Actinomycetospora sp. NBRC 106375 TaxID=3032207 RepID=UPI0024A35D07|nr:DUF6703 family protein [Actinomycetospora sp. NBRC 106375]GLZ47130.1 hypothetical protein Acsp06_33150 [Actinomycetospora sp. NBRC 106375]
MSGRGPGRARSPFARRRGRMVPGDGPLARVPPVAVFAVVAVVFAAGVIIGGFAGAVLLGALAIAVAVLLATTWPRLTSAERLVRILVLAILVAITVGLVVR